MNKLGNPKVSVSYSTPKQDWVENLSKRLREVGVDTTVDIWDLKPGHDINVFMEEMVRDDTIDYVLIICDKTYMDKANNRKGGVGTETTIISSELYGKPEQEKFIPIVIEKDNNGIACVPTYLKSRKYIDFSTEDKFESSYKELLDHIYGENNKPPLGEKPQWINTEGNGLSKTTAENNLPQKKLEITVSLFDKRYEIYQCFMKYWNIANEFFAGDNYKKFDKQLYFDNYLFREIDNSSLRELHKKCINLRSEDIYRESQSFIEAKQDLNREVNLFKSSEKNIISQIKYCFNNVPNVETLELFVDKIYETAMLVFNRNSIDWGQNFDELKSMLYTIKKNNIQDILEQQLHLFYQSEK